MCKDCDFEAMAAAEDWPAVIAAALEEMQLEGMPGELLQPVMTAMEPLANRWAALLGEGQS